MSTHAMNGPRANGPTALLGDPAELTAPRVLQWLARSRVMAPVWTAMRVWLGVMWIKAGVSKIWGAENPAFMHHGGAGVVGFAAHGAAAYSWWAHFLHGFVVPNAAWIAVLVAVSEFVIGVALVLGLFTRLAALGSLVLLFTYVMSGTASVCAFYALFAIVILATWRTSSWIGVGGLLAGRRARRRDRRDELGNSRDRGLAEGEAEAVATEPEPEVSARPETSAEPEAAVRPEPAAASDSAAAPESDALPESEPLPESDEAPEPVAPTRPRATIIERDAASAAAATPAR